MQAGYPGPISDYVTLARLNTSYDPQALQKYGIGYRLSQDGVATIFCHSGQAMRFLAYLEFGADRPRGNHYHRSKVEHLCIVKGSLLARYHLVGQPEECLDINLGVGDVVTVMPGCVHSYVAGTFAAALEFSPQPFDESDTIRVVGEALRSQ